jgi:hypothetical protein
LLLLAVAVQVLLQTQEQGRLPMVITLFLIPHLLAHLQVVLLRWGVVVVALHNHPELEVREVQVAGAALQVTMVLLVLQDKEIRVAVLAQIM